MTTNYKNIKFRYQWLALLIFLLLLAGAVAHNLFKSYNDLISLEEQRLITQARVINTNLSAQLHGTDHILQSMSTNLGLTSPDKWQSLIPNQRIEVITQAILGVRTLLAMDANGIVRLSNHRELIGKNLNNRDYFQIAKKNPDQSTLYVSSPFKTLLGSWGMNIVRVIRNHDGKFAGITAATLDPEYFSTLLSSVNYAKDMRTSLIHGDGILFLSAPELKEKAGLNINIPGSFFSRHLKSGKSETILQGTVYTTGEDRIMAQSTMLPPNLNMNTPLVVAVSRVTSEITKKWRAHFIMQLSILSIVTLSSAILLAAFQKYQARQNEIAIKAKQELMNTRQQLIQIIEFLPDATFVIDREKKVVIWNRAMEQMSGVAKEQMLGKGDHEYSIPFYGTRRNQLLDFLDLDKEELMSKYSHIRKEGDILDAETFCPALNSGTGAYVWATGAPLYDTNGDKIGAVESIRDITKRKKADEFLRKLTHGMEHSANAVLITDVHGNIEYVNRKFTQLTGYSQEEAIGNTPRILKSESTPPEVFRNLWSTILGGQEWRGELLNRRKNGEVYWSMTSISPLHEDSGEITHFIANVEDINERKNAEATIERLAYYDPLTDLPNRRMLHDRLELALKRSRRQESGAALLYIDLDSFKHINDSLGHPAGDRVLKEMATRLTMLLRDDDIVCRLGGDEFAIVLHDIHQEQSVAQVSQKLLESVESPIKLECCEIVTTCSIGIAIFPKDGEDPKTLEKHADIALYHAKSEGKNTFRFFQEDLNHALADRLAMEDGLRHAIERNELELYYQPKVGMESGAVTGLEALIRWNSPRFGFVSPIRFIQLAEETRIIVPIGEWVLKTACIQQVEWSKAGLDMAVAVNLSAVQFKSPSLVERLAAIIDETGIDTSKLELELTESAFVDNPEDAIHLLEQLRNLGCGISIDDFGTGYSSLSYLKAFPVTVLKIDRSFVRDLSHNSGDRAIAQSVVNLANNLDMLTVAEGVETAEQLEILRQIGCSYIQGFFYSKPVSAQEIPRLVASINSASTAHA